MFVRVALILVAVAFVVAVAARQSSGAAPAERYVVQPGDTLWSIAASHYAGDPRAAIPRIETRNGLTSPSIRPGQRLVLPSG
jgi:LysM repeat protein